MIQKGKFHLRGSPVKKKNSKPCTVYRKQYADTKTDHFCLQTQFLLLKLDPNLGFPLLLNKTLIFSTGWPDLHNYIKTSIRI